MADIRDDIREDFDYLNKKAVKYNMALKTMTSAEKPPCFKPVVDTEKLYMLTWALRGLVELMQDMLNKEE